MAVKDNPEEDQYREPDLPQKRGVVVDLLQQASEEAPTHGDWIGLPCYPEFLKPKIFLEKCFAYKFSKFPWSAGSPGAASSAGRCLTCPASRLPSPWSPAKAEAAPAADSCKFFRWKTSHY